MLQTRQGHMKITLGIITLNEEANLERCLNSVGDLADEILIVDSGSSDGTQQIAKKFKARWEHHPWEGYVKQKNYVLDNASHPWILSLDADEALSPELKNELVKIKESASKIASYKETKNFSGYSMPRCVCYEGKWIRHGDWYPDRLTRLFLRDNARFVGGKVHERLELKGLVQRLKGDIEHFSFQDAADHLARCQKYARLWAEDRAEKGKACSIWTPYLHAAFRWLRSFIFRRGFLDGKLGLRISNFAAYEVFLKYSLLRKLSKARLPKV
jgi:glycosyltransferase involved in cell wall biosynthesis